ncbi:hypothetical protein H8959_004200 [Pygathrix nigripes]
MRYPVVFSEKQKSFCASSPYLHGGQHQIYPQKLFTSFPSTPSFSLTLDQGGLSTVHFPLDGLQADREADGTEGVDEEMIVTQSQTNFMCPITLLEMKKPVKNKVCGHTYEEEAIVGIIESRHKQKKKARCPKIGCSHTNVRKSDLIQDEALRRAIENHNKKKHHSQ